MSDAPSLRQTSRDGTPGPQAHEPEGGTNPLVHYEVSDVQSGPILKSLAALAITLVVSGAIVWGFYHQMAGTQTQEPGLPLRAVQREDRIVPPEPRLHGLPGHEIGAQEEMRQMREQQRELLNSYGWVDEAQGIVRIPVEEAMRMLAEQGTDLRLPSAGGTGQ